MLEKDKVYCNLDFLRVVTEQTLKNADGSCKTLSVMRGKEYEMMIFLGRKNKKSDYFVKVYKCEPKNIFVRHAKDSYRRYDVGPLYDAFFFDEFEEAKAFIQTLFDRHPEYDMRPVVINGK